MNYQQNNLSKQQSPSVLATLRQLVPKRELRRSEALRIAELQAARFRAVTGSETGPLEESVVAALPRIRIERRSLPTSGLSYWNGEAWVITLNDSEPAARQRFTLMHEYKHIVDHGATDRLYVATATRPANEQAEQAADYFAGCVLMPKLLMKRAWGEGTQSLTALGQLFAVSPRAIEVRLAQIGITDPTTRCAPPRPAIPPRRNRFYRTADPEFTSGGIAA